MRASGRLPWLAGPPVPFRGRRWLDATLAEAIPVHAARTTATDMLVLQTRPHGVAHTPLSSLVARLTDGYLQKLNPALVDLRIHRSERYDQLSAELAAQAADPAATPAVCVIRPPADALLVGQMENRVGALTTAGSHGMRAAWMALEGDGPRAAGHAPGVLARPGRPAGRLTAGRRVGSDGEPSGGVAGRLRVLALREAALLVLLGVLLGQVLLAFREAAVVELLRRLRQAGPPALLRSGRLPRPRGTPQGCLRPRQIHLPAAPAAPDARWDRCPRSSLPSSVATARLPPRENVTVVTHGGISGGVAVPPRAHLAAPRL